MQRIRVAVVYGGRSSEHGVSVVSAAAVLAALDPAKYDVLPVGITTAGGWMLTEADPASLQISGRTMPQVEKGTAIVLPGDPTAPGFVLLAPAEGARVLDGVDVVFPVLHGRFGEDGAIQGLLEMAGVPYVGAGVFASAAGMDKEFSKKLLRVEGLAVGEFAVLRSGRALSSLDYEHLGLPVFVKPARAGSSIGITKVSNWVDLPAAVEEALRHDCKVMIEAAVVGHEIECGVLEDTDGRPIASVPAEIRLAHGHEWYDFDAKYLEYACEFDVPAKLDEDVTAALRDAACQAFEALECAGLARVDFFVRPDGSFVINEVNTMPGFTPISMFPRMWAATGIAYPELVDRLIASALRRGRPG